MTLSHMCAQNKYIFVHTTQSLWYKISIQFSFRGHCPLHHLIQALESAKLLPLLSTDRVLKQHIYTCYRSIKSHQARTIFYVLSGS